MSQLPVEIVFRAERRLGQMLKTEPKAKGTRGQLVGRKSSGGAKSEPPERQDPTLADMGIDKTRGSKKEPQLSAAKAKERMLTGKKIDPAQNSAQGKTRDVVAKIAGVSHDRGQAGTERRNSI